MLLCAVAVAVAVAVSALAVAGARAESKAWWERCEELPGDQIEACFNKHNGEEGTPQKVFVAKSCADADFAVRPHLIGISCDRTFKFYGLHWRSWGGDSAVGIGRARLQGCVPFCANGQVTRPRARLRLTHIVEVEGVRVYALLHYTLIGPLPREVGGRGPHRGTIGRLPEG